jgi:uncharacterized protein (DUF2267 family)
MSGIAATRPIPALENATRLATEWVRDVADVFDTDDTPFAYRVLRAWLHALRDRLTVPTAAHFGAQLPELLRGVFYEGWNPSRVPVRLSATEYAEHFAHEAGISPNDVPKVASAVTTALGRRMSEGQLRKAMDELPAAVRALLRPA